MSYSKVGPLGRESTVVQPLEDPGTLIGLMQPKPPVQTNSYVVGRPFNLKVVQNTSDIFPLSINKFVNAKTSG